MCDIAKGRRTFRDQDPPRICKDSSSLKSEPEISKSTPSSPTILQRASGLEKCLSEPEFFEKKENRDYGGERGTRDTTRRTNEDFVKELADKVPSCRHEVITNGLKSDTDICDGLTNGRKMAPVLGVPPPPPPAPHMGPDGLILPRKPYNPCLTSSNHKDLRRELLFNQKIGKNVLNQKTELQRALEKQREAASRREAEKNREENYKDDPRTALQRAIEQRARNIQMTLEQSQPTTEPPNNLLITARAKLRPRTDSQ